MRAPFNKRKKVRSTQPPDYYDQVIDDDRFLNPLQRLAKALGKVVTVGGYK